MANSVAQGTMERARRGNGASAGWKPDSSSLVNGNVCVGSHRTSIRLEPAMWEGLAEICKREGKSKHELCTLIAECRISSCLTAAIRTFIMSYFRAAATEEGHASVGHGRLFGWRPDKWSWR